MYVVSETTYTAKGTAGTFMYKQMAQRGVQRKLLLGGDKQFPGKRFTAVSKGSGSRRLFTSSYHPNRNGEMERAIHATAQILSAVTDDSFSQGGICTCFSSKRTTTVRCIPPPVPRQMKFTVVVCAMLTFFGRKRPRKDAYTQGKALDPPWWLSKIHLPGPASANSYYIPFLDP